MKLTIVPNQDENIKNQVKEELDRRGIGFSEEWPWIITNLSACGKLGLKFELDRRYKVLFLVCEKKVFSALYCDEPNVEWFFYHDSLGDWSFNDYEKSKDALMCGGTVNSTAGLHVTRIIHKNEKIERFVERTLKDFSWIETRMKSVAKDLVDRSIAANIMSAACEEILGKRKRYKKIRDDGNERVYNCGVKGGRVAAEICKLNEDGPTIYLDLYKTKTKHVMGFWHIFDKNRDTRKIIENFINLVENKED